VQWLASPPEKSRLEGRPSKDSRYTVSASVPAWEATVWDLKTGKPAVAPLSHPDAVFAARFDPSGDRVVTACRDGKTRIWDWRRGQLSIPPLVQVEEVTDAAFSPDGRLIATAESSGAARVWDARSGLPLAPGWLLQPPGSVLNYYSNRLEFSADGRYLLVGVRGRHLLVYDVAHLTAPPAEDLTPEDVVQLAEINAGLALLPNGNIEPLTTDRWLQRWQTFRGRRPKFHLWPETEFPRTDRGRPNP